MFRGLFVTGTDTNVGKTVVSAAVMLRYRAEAPLRYWKPVQTGIEHDDDSREVARLAGMPAILDRGVRLPHPGSPHPAPRLAGTRITVRPLVAHMKGGARTRWVGGAPRGVLVALN